MHRLIALFACMAVMFSLAGGAVAHAAAPPTCVESTARAVADAIHVEGDADEVAADAEKGYPHHHESCHGHDVGASFVHAIALNVPAHVKAMRAPTVDRHTTSGGDPALRPPRA